MNNKFKTFSKRVLISVVTIIVAIQLLDIPITSALASMGVRTAESNSVVDTSDDGVKVTTGKENISIKDSEENISTEESKTVKIDEKSDSKDTSSGVKEDVNKKKNEEKPINKDSNKKVEKKEEKKEKSTGSLNKDSIKEKPTNEMKDKQDNKKNLTAREKFILNLRDDEQLTKSEHKKLTGREYRTADQKPLELTVEDVVGDEANKNIKYLTENEFGEVMYGDVPLYVGGGNEIVPDELEKLKIRGVKGKTDEKVSLIDKLKAIALGQTVYAASGPNIELVSDNIWSGQSRVGLFKVDGEYAFCFEHGDYTPTTGQSFNDKNPYNNDKIARALYYGAYGEENIFGNNSDNAIVVTSLVISRLYNGKDAGGQSLDGYDKLWDKANSNEDIFHGISMSDSNLSVSVSGKVQKSQTTQFKASSKNKITFSLPSKVKLVNESNGKSKTGGSVTISGGERFHLEAPLDYSGNFDTGKIYGSLKTYQPIIAMPKASAYQTLGYGQLWKDPNNYVQLKATFKKRQVKMTIHYNDRDAHAVLDKYTRTKMVTIGDKYTEKYRTDVKIDGAKETALDDNTSKTGTVPDSDFTVTFWYKGKYAFWLDYLDSTTGNKIQKSTNAGNYFIGDSLSRTVTSTIDANNMEYRITRSTNVTGKMAKGGTTIKINYDPYVNFTVNHIDNYNGSILKTENKGKVKVGTNYDVTGMTDNFNQDGHQYRITGSTNKKGTVPRRDLVVDFKYNPYNVLKVRHIDTYNNSILSTDDKGYVKVGNTYTVTGKTSNFVQNGHQYRITGDTKITGVMPYADKTVDFKYDPYNNLTVRHIDTYNEKVLSTDKKGYVKVGSEYELTGKTENFLQGGHQYRIVAPKSVKAIMPYEDKTVDFRYDPYNIVKINNVDTYSKNVMWTDDKGYVKVGSTYNYTGKTTKDFANGSHWYNIIAPSSLSAVMPYKDVTLTFKYDPYNKVTIDNIDTYNDSIIWTDNMGLVKVGSSYSYTGKTDKNFLKNLHYYNIIAPSKLTGKMPYNDLKLEFKYDPYQYITLFEKNMYPEYDLFKTTKKLFKVGTTNTFKATQTHKVDNGARIFDVFGDSVTIKTPYKDSEHTFDYKLRRNITVNYYDVRTGKKVSETKTYTLHEKDKYAEKPITIKDGEYTLRYVKTTGDSESGTVGTKHITVNYYYDKPMIKVGLEKVQIYTAKNTEGLPVKVDLSKVVNYTGDTSKIADFKDANKTIKVTLYQDKTVIKSQTYTAQKFPEHLDWKIDKKFLTKNTHKPYTVKIETDRDMDFHVVKGRENLTTEGWTSNQQTITFDVNSNDKHQDSQSFVVMTEKTPTTAMKEYFEKLTYKATPLGETKTGYGVSTNVTFSYENDLGTNYKLATDVPSNSMKFYAPNSLRDSYLNYPTVGNNMEMDMLNKETSKQESGKFKQSNTFTFQHVNVEKQTGNLFTDKQVADKDSRIKNAMRDGGNVFYTPIWNDLGTYNVSYKTSEIGVHKFKLTMKDKLKLSAHMFVHVDSKTVARDEILLVPINADNPFDGKLPEGWTKEDVEWLKYDK